METKITTATAPSGATAEIVTVVFQGIEFTALGAVIDHENGVATGYPEFETSSQGILCEFVGSRGRMLNSAGSQIGTCRITASWKTPRSYVSSHMHQIEAWIDGNQYTGRSAGSGMLWKGKLKKTKTK